MQTGLAGPLLGWDGRASGTSWNSSSDLDGVLAVLQANDNTE